MRTSRALAPLVVVAFLLSACSTGEDGPSGDVLDAADVPDGVTAGPEGDAFYVAGPPGAGTGPGDLVWARRIPAPPGADGFAILYWSTTVDDELVPVSGVVYRPEDAPSNAPVLAWAHGTTGLGQECAASISRYGATRVDLSFENRVVELGLTFVATDYQGLGTADPHPYMVNVSAARNVLDSVRALAQLVGSGTRPQVVLVGESQGGAATLLAAELYTSYAPELVVRGAVALAPPSSLRELDEALEAGEFFGYVLMTVQSYKATYAELAELDHLLTPEGREALGAIGSQCADDILRRYAGGRAADYGVDTVIATEEFGARLDDNEPGTRLPGTPILIVHGDADETIPVEFSLDLLERYCDLGARVTTRIVPGAGHLVLRSAIPEVQAYVSDRFAGSVATSSCS